MFHGIDVTFESCVDAVAKAKEEIAMAEECLRILKLEKAGSVTHDDIKASDFYDRVQKTVRHLSSLMTELQGPDYFYPGERERMEAEITKLKDLVLKRTPI